MIQPPPTAPRSTNAPSARSADPSGDHETPAPQTAQTMIQVRGLRAWYGSHRVLHGVDLDLPARAVTAIIGPSGCGKSTFVRCLNRMHETVPGARQEGSVRLALGGGDPVDIFHPDVDPTLLRRHVGMVFQKPNPFPTMSVRDNVLSGLRLTGRLALPRGLWGGRRRTAEADGLVEHALRQAALWEEVRDRLDDPGMSLSGGQQQRLCIARSLAVDPDVLLMDEPASALDPIATARIEDLLHSLKERYTIVIVTHNMQQAARVSDRTAFFLNGELVEVGETSRLFTAPRDPRTEDYITGKFG